MTLHDPPDPQRHARRPARRDARAARDHRRAARASSSGAATARSRRRRSSTRRCCARRTTALRPAYRVFDDHGEVLALRADMTVPIARLVATRYADRRAAAALLLLRATPTARCGRTAGRCASSCRRASSWSARPAPDGHGRGADRAVPRARRGRPARLPRSGSATPALYPALLRRLRRRPTRRASGCSHELATRDFVGLEREVARARRSAPRPPTLLVRVPQLRGGARGARRRRRARWPSALGGLRALLELLERRRRRARDLRPRPGARPGLLHGRRLRRLRPRARRADRRRRALRRPARRASAARCRRSASRSASTACTLALAGEERDAREPRVNASA